MMLIDEDAPPSGENNSIRQPHVDFPLVSCSPIRDHFRVIRYLSTAIYMRYVI